MSDDFKGGIIRAPRTKPYFSTRRDTAQDDTLSFEARGLLWYLLSKPDNWQVRIKDLQNSGKIGRDKAKKLLTELKTAGYIVQEPQKQREDGTFAPVEYRIYEEPFTENPSTVNPSTENQSPYIIQSPQITEVNKKTLAPPENGAVTPDMEKPGNGEKPKPRNEWYDVIAETFGVEGWRNGQIANILRGHTKSVDKKYALDTPLTDVQQVRNFWSWYQRECPGCDLASPAKVQDYVMRWQKEQASTFARPAPLDPLQPPPPDPVYPGDGLVPIWRPAEE